MIPGVVASGQNFPLSLGPIGWWDASDPTTITASGSPLRVSQWNSIVGSGIIATQGTGGLQPIYDPSIDAIHFDGAATSAPRRLATNLSSIRTECTIFVVAESTATPTNAFGNVYGLVGSSVGPGLGQGWVMGGDSSTFLNQVRSSAGIAAVTGATYDNDLHVQTLRGVSNDFLEIQTDKGTVFSVSHTRTPSGSSNWLLGDTPSGNVYFRGYIHEAIFFDRSLNVDETEAVQNYQIAKWAI